MDIKGNNIEESILARISRKIGVKNKMEQMENNKQVG